MQLLVSLLPEVDAIVMRMGNDAHALSLCLGVSAVLHARNLLLRRSAGKEIFPWRHADQPQRMTWPPSEQETKPEIKARHRGGRRTGRTQASSFRTSPKDVTVARRDL
jgi:hypothetical protein